MAIPADFVEVLAVFDSDWVLQAWRARSEVKLIQPMRPQIEIESKEVKIENRPPCQIEIEPAYESQEITIELNGVKKALNSMKIDREPQISEYDLKVWIGEIIDVPGRKHMFIYAIRDTFVEPMSEDETFLKFRIALRLQELAGAETVTNTGDIVSDKLAAFTEDMVKRMIKCEKKHNIPNVEFNHEAKRSVAMLLAHGKW